jgi:tetratricopeptide (TPR) repeat protein
VLSDLLDRQRLTRMNGGWAFDGAALQIPDSVQGVLAARIDQLEPAAKDALQAAAVIGRSFSPAGLAALVGSAAEVRTLVERGFVRATEPELVFKHALTRDVAYDGLPKAERARRHAAYAEWLEGVDAGDGRAGTLAYHYAEAVDPQIADLAWRDRDEDVARLRASALRWLHRASELAVRRFDLDDALALLARAVELTPDDPELWHSIGRVNALKFDGVAFWASMLEAVERTTDPAKLGELYAELVFESTQRGAMWKGPPDMEVVNGWIAQALELAPAESRSYARVLIAKGMLEDDVAPVERAIAIAEGLRDVELLSYGLSARSGLAQYFGDFAAAAEFAQRQLRLASQLNDPDHLAMIEFCSATAELALGNVDDAERHALRHDAIARRLTPHHEVHAIGGLLIFDEAAGRWERLHERATRTEGAVAANADTPCVFNARSLLACAAACAAVGLDDEARRFEAEESALGFEGWDYHLDPLRARLAMIRGDLSAVEALLEGSEKWSWKIYDFVNCVAARLDAFVAVGRAAEAVEDAERYALPGTYLEPFALRTLGVARSDPALVARAQERFEAMGLGWYAAQTPALAGDALT